MNVGTWEDLLDLERLAGQTLLTSILAGSTAGVLTPRAWSFWHYRLGLSDVKREPPPRRTRAFQCDEMERPVKLSFLGGTDFGRVGARTLTSGDEILLASPLDLLGHKLKVLLQRIDMKDHRDIAALLRSGLRIEQGLGAAQALFGSSFPPADAMRTLTYFGEGDCMALPQEDKATLIDAAKNAGAIVAAEIVAAKIVANDLTVPTPISGDPGSGRRVVEQANGRP